MKIFTADQFRAADEQTIAQEGISSVDLMERAAIQVVKWLLDQSWLTTDRLIHVMAGPGNNGGDGYAIARLLKESGYQVQVEQVLPPTRDDCKINAGKWLEMEGASPLSIIGPETVLIDALFGTGLNRELDGAALVAVEKINNSGATVVSVDIPSGLPTNELNDAVSCVAAHYTLSFQLPKPIFFNPSAYQVVGNWHLLHIGLSQQYIDKTVAMEHWVVPAELRDVRRKRGRFDHKGVFGHAVLVGGSEGKFGAICLAASAAVSSGAGLVSVHLPKNGHLALYSTVPEAMILPVDDDQIETIERVPELPAKCNAIAIGPGLGESRGAERGLKSLLDRECSPMVIDADGLNVLAENKTWLDFLKPQTILTPHPGEFGRLVGSGETFEAQKLLLRNFCVRYNLIVVLKGGYTMVGSPTGMIYHNTTGNPGMASGGMGDCLTGLIVSLLAQGIPPLEAAIYGVAVHAAAGDLVAKELGVEAVTASRVIEQLGTAMRTIENS